MGLESRFQPFSILELEYIPTILLVQIFCLGWIDKICANFLGDSCNCCHCFKILANHKSQKFL